MARRDDIREMRRSLAINAAERWEQRADPREDSLLKAARVGPSAADSPERVELFRRMLEQRPLVMAEGQVLVQERVIGPTLDFTDRPPDERARKAGLPVCRIVELGGPGTVPEGFGTGFMVTADLLLTNHHVLPKPESAVGVGANFSYERIPGGLSEGEIFELRPETFYMSNEALDFALVAVSPHSRNGETVLRFGFHKLIRPTGKILIGHPINIIQHPEGGPKKYAVTGNKLLDVLDFHLHYETDTLPGSSGSPTFNEFWEVVSLHHSGVPEMRNGKFIDRKGNVWNGKNDEDIHWIANEGIRVSKLMAYLDSIVLPSTNQQALLRQIFNVEHHTSVSQEASAVNLMNTSASTISRDKNMNLAHANFTITGTTTINIGTPSLQAAAATQAPETFTHERKMLFDPEYGNRRGFESGFLRGHEVALPMVRKTRAKEMLLDRYGHVVILDYHHFSLALNKKRRLQMWSAVNVDWSPEMNPRLDRKELGNDTWVADPRVPAQLQLADEEFYSPAKKFDRGHIIRRADNAWGASEQEVRYANADTFHWTNCSPQHEGFNRSDLGGLWGKLENHVTEQSPAVKDKLILLAGPVLNNEEDLEHDWGGGTIQIPIEFWKVIVVAEEDEGTRHGKLAAYGFMLEQSSTIKKRGLEGFEAAEFAPYQRSLREISEASGVEFDEILHHADVLTGVSGDEPREKRRIRKPRDIRKRPDNLGR